MDSGPTYFANAVSYERKRFMAVTPGLDGQEKEVELDVADFCHFREGHADEGWGQRLRDDELVAGVEVVLLPLWNV